MSKDLFVDKNPSLETSWRSIILLGRNVASYKFALAKSLLEIDSNNSEIELEKLAIPFAKNICEHLDKNEKQITSSSSKFLDACKRFNNSQINEDELRNITVRLGFNNVIDAFHIVSREETTRFFTDNRLSLIHISEPTRHLRNSYAVFCLKKKNRVLIYSQTRSRLLFVPRRFKS